MTEKKLVVWLGAMVLAGAACSTHQTADTPGAPPVDVESPIILFPKGSTCMISAKQPTVTAHADKWLQFEVVNYCESAQVVVVGNFRTVQNPSPPPANCDNPTYGEAPSVFQQDALNRRTANLPAGSAGDPEEGDIRLKIKKNADLPGSSDLTYYFDICLGGALADPELIVRR